MPPGPDPERSRTQRFQLVMRLFDDVVALPPEARLARLVELCPDEDVRREVEAMLALDGTTSHPISVGGGLDRLARLPADGAVQGLPREPAEIPLLRGQYRIVRQIGEGGMGVVYEAEQALPRRTVALKAVRTGFDSRAVLRRFEQEAHILGRLHHPGIAQIYEAGASDAQSGDQAFIAMEFVDGVPLHDWARGRSVREKVALVATICDAVQHAHQRRVIHRDLKPANILVDRAGHAKILDFGVARLADADTGDEGQRTRAGQLVGTLPYMSPEQVGGDPDEIDARTDVWALGVILFELLAGRLPFEPGERTVPQIAIAIRDEAAPRLGRIVPRLAGDLDAITSMALAKDRGRRYQSALELGQDLRRYLTSEPVLARQDSSLYVLRKHVLRHRWIASSLALALVSLAAFAVNAKLNQRRADRDARQLADALRSSNIELGRLMAFNGNLIDAERLVWDEHLKLADAHSHWALWDLYSKLPCERSFPGHTDSVIQMAMSPDGSLLATGSHDHTVRLWDWQTGANTATHTVDGFILGVCFARGGERLCSATAEGLACCWDAKTGTEVWRTREPLLSAIYTMSSARTRPIGAVVGQLDGAALVDLDTGAVIARLGERSQGLRSAAFDSVGRRLVVGGDDRTVHVYAVDARDELRSFTGHATPVEGLAIDAQDARVASGDVEGVVLVHELETGRELARLAGTSGNVRSLAFSRDGTRLLVACTRGIEMWDIDAGRRFEARAQFRQPAFAATFAPGDRQIVSGSLGGAIRVWDIESTSAVRALPNRFERKGYFGLAPGSRLAARDAGEGRVEIVDLETGVVGVQFQTNQREIEQILYQPSGDRVAVLTQPNHLSVWRTSDGAPVCAFDTPTRTGTVRFSPDGKLLGATSDEGVIRLFDPDRGVQLDELHQKATVIERLAFSADSRRVATTHRGRRVEVWRLDPPRLERAIDTPRAVFALTFEPVGDRLWVGTWDGRVLVYSLANGELLHTLEGHVQQVQGLVPKRDGSLFVTSGGDGVLRLWNHDVGVGLIALDPQAGTVLTFGFSPDERCVRAVYLDGTVRDWDLGFYDAYIAGNESSQRARVASERR